MKELQWPLRKNLRAGIDDLAIARIWQRLDRSRPAAASRRITWPSAWALVSATALVLAALLVGSFVGRPMTTRVAAGPLRLAVGGGLEGNTLQGNGALAGKLATEEDARTLALSDGSTVLLRPRSSLEVLENDGNAFVALLASGAARFEVQPGGPRRWTIECGVAVVEVVGTRFSIRHEPARVRVDVEHGIVLVRSEFIADHVRRLTDGQSLDVFQPADRPSAGDGSVAAAAPSSPSAPRTEAPAPPGAAWRDLAARGNFTEAYSLLGSGGVHHISEVGAVHDLLTVADVARLSGHPREAVAPLRRILEEHPDDPSASLAAFTLGRVQLDALGDAADAADSFARALALRVPPGLEEDAYVRLVEARERAGDQAGARRAAEEYRARFPHGALSHEVSRWVDAP